MNVLSLFDGMSCGRIALDRANIKVDNYYAPKYDRGIAFNDEKLKIDWLFSIKDLQLSDKDKIHPSLANSKDLFK